MLSNASEFEGTSRREADPIGRLRVKVCGIRTVAEAIAAADAGVDAIGLNFYGKSRRYVSDRDAALIADAVGGRMLMVGLFVNELPETIDAIRSSVGLDFVQLHGDEPASLWRGRGDFPLIRALRWPPAGPAETDFVREWGDAADAALVTAYLVDANIRGLFGGTGATTDWGSLTPRPAVLQSRCLVLAGGLTPANVAAAIQASHCDAVDTAGGVESSDGSKDPRLMAEFAAAARAAFSSHSN